MDGNLIRGNVDTIILKALRTGGEMYGLEICNLIHRASEGTYELKKPTLYSALKRLQHNKLIAIRVEESPIGGERHYYKLTPKGEEFLDTKKFDWVCSKVLIDNLVFDKTTNEELKQAPDEGPIQVFGAPVTTAAPIPEPAATQPTPTLDPIIVRSAINIEPQVVTSIRDISPVEQYSAKSGEVIDTGLSRFSNGVTDNAGLSNFVGGAGKPILKQEQQVYPGYQPQAQPYSQEMMVRPDYQPQYQPQGVRNPYLKPFVKHATEKKTGQYVLFNKIRFFASCIVSTILCAVLFLTTMLLKSNYTSAEGNFIAVAWVCLGVYLLTNLILFIAYPKYKQIITTKNQGILRRFLFTVCIIVISLSINILAGLSNFNIDNFIVYMVFPIIIGSLFFLEGLAIMCMRRLSFFLT